MRLLFRVPVFREVLVKPVAGQAQSAPPGFEEAASAGAASLLEARASSSRRSALARERRAGKLRRTGPRGAAADEAAGAAELLGGAEVEAEEARERERLEAWASEQQERVDGGERQRRARSRVGKRRRAAVLLGLGVLGWAGLNARVRSLGGADDTLGHALGRSFNARSFGPLRDFGRRLSPGWAAAGASTWGGTHALKAGDLKGAGALDCDVLVVGATPSGVAAALAAARRGAQVIVVEKHPHAGGDVVYAMLNMFDVMARPGETARVHGLFAEFFEQLGVSCDIDRARDLFDNALKAEPNIRFIPSVVVASTYKDGDKLVGVQIQQGKATRGIACKVLVDATNDADIATMAGSGFYIGREDANPDKKMQSAGLLFSVKGVNWGRVRAYVSGRRAILMSQRPNARTSIDIAPTSLAQKKRLAQMFAREDHMALPGVKSMLAPSLPGAVARGSRAGIKGSLERAEKVWLRLGGGMGNYAWERGDIIKGYQPHGPDIIVLSINFGRQSDGSVVLNTLNIINVDGISPQHRQQAREEGIRELPYFLKYLRKKMPGFERATLARIAPELYIRETRHIHGFYSLKVHDIRGQAKFFDRIAQAAYPLDLHPYSKTDLNPYGPRRYFYTIPLRCLIPRGVDNVFVASRSLSATYSAAGSARVIPVTMAAGEGAGVAAWECARNGRTPHELLKDFPLMQSVQDSLRKGGADLGD